MTDLEQAAKAAAGNWKKFDSFAWHRAYDLDDADNWTIVYTSNRDSGLLDQSNAAAIEKQMEPFTKGDDPDAVSESHNHWAVGHVDGYSIRVYKDGEITPAFTKWMEIKDQLDDYPVLDEEDYSRREDDATIDNIREEGRFALRNNDKSVSDLPDDWAEQVYSWLSDNTPNALENRDDQGGYPSSEDILEALYDLGLAQDKEADEKEIREMFEKHNMPLVEQAGAVWQANSQYGSCHSMHCTKEEAEEAAIAYYLDHMNLIRQ